MEAKDQALRLVEQDVEARAVAMADEARFRATAAELHKRCTEAAERQADALSQIAVTLEELLFALKARK